MKYIDESRVHNFLSDLLSAEKHTLKAVQNQKESKGVKSDEEAYEMLQHIERTLAIQVEKLSEAADRFGSNTVKNVKSKLTGFLGTIAGMIDQARIDPVSKLMRDNYTAIAMITAGHTMLKTTALIVEDEDLQHIAGESLKELAQLTTQISRILPLTVARGIIDDKDEADRIGKLAIEKTQKAWKEQNIKKGKDVI